jgi:hypothetical protein
MREIDSEGAESYNGHRLEKSARFRLHNSFA